jgi:hypothetical protein
MDTWSMDNLSEQDISKIEADCYWCLSKFLDGMQDHYTFAQPGIQRLVFRLKELVRRIDGMCFWFSCIASSGSTLLSVEIKTHACRGISLEVPSGWLVSRIASSMYWEILFTSYFWIYAEPVSKHMEEQGLEFLQFAFRWFNCLLIREVCHVTTWFNESYKH